MMNRIMDANFGRMALTETTTFGLWKTMDNVCTTPTSTFPPSLAGSVIPRDPKGSTTTTESLSCSTGTNGRPRRGHVLTLPTELLAVIFELANDDDPFLLAKEARPHQSERKNTSFGEVKQDPSAVVDEIHSTAPLDKWDYPLPLAISRTCNRFRTIALSTPMLWSRISIYREQRIESCKTEDGVAPHRWGMARLYLTRATRPYLKTDGTLRHDVNKGVLDIRIFASMYTCDDWTESMINERWFGASDMNELCNLLLPFAPLFRSFTCIADSWEPIYTFIHRSSHLRAPNLERLELIRTNTHPGKQEEFYPQIMSEPLKLFCGKADDETFVEEGCLGRLREVILAGVHLDWRSFLISLLSDNDGVKSTNLEGIYLNYLAWSVRPSLPLFLSFLTASPYLETLGLQAGGPDPRSTEHYDIDPTGDYVAPWAEMLPPHPRIPTLSNLRTMTLKFLEPDDAIEILASMRSVLGASGGRLTGLKTLHLGDLAGLPEWQQHEPSLLPLVEELERILPLSNSVPASEESIREASGLTALSLTGFKERYFDSDLLLEEGGFKASICALTTLDVFRSVTSLRLVFCDPYIIEALRSQSYALQEGSETMELPRFPMPKLTGLWVERCEGAGFHYNEEERENVEKAAMIAYPLASVLKMRHDFISGLQQPLSSAYNKLEVLGYARKDARCLSNLSLALIKEHVPRMTLWGREEGEVEESAADEPMTREEEDEILIREAEEYYDPEFEYYCNLAFQKEEQGFEADDDGFLPEMEDNELPDPTAVIGAPLPLPLAMSNPMVDVDVDSILDEPLPTPRNPYQSFFNLDPLANYHRYMTGTRNDDGMRGVELDAGLDVDCGASTSTHPSTALSSPSTSTSSLPTSTAPSEASSICGDPESDDTLPFDDTEKLGVFRDVGTDFELDAY